MVPYVCAVWRYDATPSKMRGREVSQGPNFWKTMSVPETMDWFKGKFTGLSPIFNGKLTLVSG